MHIDVRPTSLALPREFGSPLATCTTHRLTIPFSVPWFDAALGGFGVLCATLFASCQEIGHSSPGRRRRVLTLGVVCCEALELGPYMSDVLQGSVPHVPAMSRRAPGAGFLWWGGECRGRVGE